MPGATERDCQEEELDTYQVTCPWPSIQYVRRVLVDSGSPRVYVSRIEVRSGVAELEKLDPSALSPNISTPGE